MAHQIIRSPNIIQNEILEQFRGGFDSKWGLIPDRGRQAAAKIIELVCNNVATTDDQLDIPIVGTGARVNVKIQRISQIMAGRVIDHQPETFGGHPKLLLVLTWSLYNWIEHLDDSSKNVLQLSEEGTVVNS